MSRSRLAILAVAALVGCAGRRDEPVASSSTARAQGAAQLGRATYYADSLAGRRTASGEPYDPGELTAAHRTLPFGTEVEVVRRDGRAVRVRVNDRGPFGRAAARGVVIDLSRAAAERIGMIREGVVDVSIQIVSSPLPRVSAMRAR